MLSGYTVYARSNTIDVLCEPAQVRHGVRTCAIDAKVLRPCRLKSDQDDIFGPWPLRDIERESRASSPMEREASASGSCPRFSLARFAPARARHKRFDVYPMFPGALTRIGPMAVTTIAASTIEGRN